MLRTITNTIKRYPEQALLFLYNAGIFAWMQSTSHSIMEQIGIDSNWFDKIPEPIKVLDRCQSREYANLTQFFRLGMADCIYDIDVGHPLC